MTTAFPLADARPGPPARGAGAPGQSGLLDVAVERIAGRTRISELRSRAPLQALRPHYLDPALPDMAFLTIASPSGGVLQGDRLDLHVRLGEGARLHLDTQGATRLYRSPAAPAEASTMLTLGPGAYLEYLPDPYIPYAGSRFDVRMECRVAEDATLIFTELLTAGREAHGERHAFQSFRSRSLFCRPDGDLIAADALELSAGEKIAAAGRMGGYGVVGSLFVIHRGFGSAVLEAAAILIPERVVAGTSSLPGDAGAWLRVLASSPAEAAGVLATAVAAARLRILGALPPPTRRA